MAASGHAHIEERCLTPRSSGAPTAGHQARAGGTRYIFASPGLASCRCRPLNSNVRPHQFPNSRRSLQWQTLHQVRAAHRPRGALRAVLFQGAESATSCIGSAWFAGRGTRSARMKDGEGVSSIEKTREVSSSSRAGRGTRRGLRHSLRCSRDQSGGVSTPLQVGSSVR
jgi:hypothetical protein